MADAIESELKLRAVDEAALDRLAAAGTLAGARLGAAQVVAETDVYLDTADGRLAAARWACRWRTREGRSWISLKGPAQHLAGEALHRRPEVEGQVDDPRLPAGWPSSPARRLVLELAGEAPLQERLTLRQARTERDVVDEAGSVGTLTLDRVEVRAEGRERGRLLVVELELEARMDSDRQARLVAQLLPVLEAYGLVREPASKLELALDLLR